MSRSDHNRSRRHPARHYSVRIMRRIERRQWKRWARLADDSVPYPLVRHGDLSSCGHGCCW
jgi:hypothetical protein